jgi:hypothetical protein
MVVSPELFDQVVVGQGRHLAWSLTTSPFGTTYTPVDVTHDFRSDHNQLFHQGIKTVLLAEVTPAGATVKEPAHDVGGGHLVATVTDPDGNVLGPLQDR